MSELRKVQCSTGCGKTYYVRDDDAACPHKCHHILCIADLERKLAEAQEKLKRIETEACVCNQGRLPRPFDCIVHDQQSIIARILKEGNDD